MNIEKTKGERLDIGYDPASKDGDKARVVVKNPDGTIEVFVPESEVTSTYLQAVEDCLSVVDEQKYREKAINGEFVEMDCDINSTIFVIENKLKSLKQLNHESAN